MIKLPAMLKSGGAIFILLAMLVPLGLTFYAWQVTSENLGETQYAKFSALANESEKALLYRMDSYKQALLGGKGFFEGSERVARREWEAYVTSIDILTNFPGINGIGSIYDVKKSDIPQFEQQAQRDGYTHFSIHPEGDHPKYFVIKYIEPMELNEKAVGLNTGFEANRREAATKSRDSGKPAITKRILLVQDAEQQPGFLLLLPTYDTAQPIRTVEERRRAFKRWIYAPFIAKNFMNKLTQSQGKTLHLQVYDGEVADPNALIYDSNKNEKRAASQFVISKPVEIMQQKWLLVWSSTPTFERIEKTNEPMLILISGLMFTGLFSVFVIVMVLRSSGEEALALSNFIVPVFAFFVTLAGSVYLYSEIDQKEDNFIANATSEASESISDSIDKNVESRILALGRMAKRWTIRNGTPQREWSIDAELYVKDQPGLKVVEWVDSSFHVRWVEPLIGNERALGLDILFDKKREEALKGAAEKGAVTVTPPLQLVQGYKAFITYSPVQKDHQFDGFIVGIFGVDELIDAAISGASKEDFVVQLRHEGKIFFTSADSPPPNKKHWLMERVINVGDRNWDVIVFPKPTFIKQNTSFLPDLILATGVILGLMVAVIINFAQRSKQTTMLVREKENLLSTFVKHAPAAVAMFDTNVNYIAASDRWYKDYNLGNRDIIGENHYDIFPEVKKNHPEWLLDHQRVLRGEVIRVDEEPFLRRDGTTEWLRYELRPWMKSTNEIGGLIMFTENITERKQMDIMKNEFISTVNHELRTPLTSIQGALGLLKAKFIGALDEKGQRLLSLSVDNCTRLANLVNDMLDMEKIAAGKMEYNMEVHEMNSLVKDVIERHLGYAEKFNVSFDMKIPDEKIYAYLDSNRFNQALVNLLSNAAKFSPEKGVVTVGLMSEGKSKLRVSVADNGQGIPKKFQDKVFSKFAQADSSSTRTSSGTGLGLNITQSIIEAFGGEVSFDTTEGKGTVFHIVLPTCKPHHPEKSI